MNLLIMIKCAIQIIAAYKVSDFIFRFFIEKLLIVNIYFLYIGINFIVNILLYLLM